VAGDQHQLRVGHRLGVVEQLHAAAVGQHQVEQDDVGLLQGHLPPRLAQRAGGGHGEAFVGDQHRHRFRRVGVVVYQESVRHSVRRFEEPGKPTLPASRGDPRHADC
jgi:hypothetical protein